MGLVEGVLGAILLVILAVVVWHFWGDLTALAHHLGFGTSSAGVVASFVGIGKWARGWP